MARAHRKIELAVRIGNQPGAMARVLKTVAEAGVDILAYCSYSDRDDFVMLLIPERPQPAKNALESAGFHCKANAVVLVAADDRVGAAAELGSHLGHAGINILYSYASSAQGQEFFAVFKTTDDEATIRLLEDRPQQRAHAA